MEFTLEEFNIALSKAVTLNEKEVAEIIDADIKDHIAKSESIDGEPYPPLKSSTIRAKQQKGDTETRPIARVADYIEIRAGRGEVFIELKKDYASYLQDKYNFLGLSEDAVKEIDKLLQRQIDRILGD